MKNAKKNANKKKYTNPLGYLLLAVVFASIIMSIGYAQVSNVNLLVSGTANTSMPDDVFIFATSIDSNSQANVINSDITLTNLTTMQSKVVLNQNQNSYLRMSITIYNNSDNNVYFDKVTFANEFYDNNNIDFTLNGLSHGQLLAVDQSVVFTITFKYSDTYIATNPSVFDDELNSYINFSFKKGYTITYNGFNSTNGLDTLILENQTLNETFTSTTGIPYNVTVTGATATYSSPTLSLSNPTNNVVVNRLFSITYTGFTGNTSGLISSVTNSGASITFNSTTGIPDNVTVTGATANYNSPVLELSNVTDNITITSAASRPFIYTLNIEDYVLHGQPISNDVTVYNSPEAAMASFHNKPFYFKHILQNGVVDESYLVIIITPEMAAADTNLTAGTYTFRGGINESELTDKPVFEANLTTLTQAFGNSCDYTTDPENIPCYSELNFQLVSNGNVSFYTYIPEVSDVIFCGIDTDGDSNCRI